MINHMSWEQTSWTVLLNNNLHDSSKNTFEQVKHCSGTATDSEVDQLDFLRKSTGNYDAKILEINIRSNEQKHIQYPNPIPETKYISFWISSQHLNNIQFNSINQKNIQPPISNIQYPIQWWLTIRKKTNPIQPKPGVSPCYNPPLARKMSRIRRRLRDPRDRPVTAVEVVNGWGIPHV